MKPEKINILICTVRIPVRRLKPDRVRCDGLKIDRFDTDKASYTWSNQSARIPQI